MKSNFNELRASNDKYDIYVTKKVFLGYTLKKFLKEPFMTWFKKLI